jgi:hypothetical protein
MSSAFRTFTSAAGVGSACYLLAMATWDQVLLLFLTASLGWSIFVFLTEHRKAVYGSHSITKTNPEIIKNLIAQREAEVPTFQEPPRKVYKFPIHELAGASTPRSVQAFE